MGEIIMTKSPNWTQEEITLLTQVYPELGKSNELQLLFPTRNLNAISLKASRLGLKIKRNIRAGRSNEEYLELLEKTNFIALDTYKGSTEAILHMCGDCEYEWLARPQQLLKIGAKCPICSHKSRLLSLDTVDNTLLKANLIRLSEYTGSLDKILVKHTKCDHEWWTVYSYIEQGSGCPKCNRGYGYKHSVNTPDIATLYLFKIHVGAEIFLKVGVTCRPINIRQRELKSSIGLELNPIIEVLSTISGTGKYILDIEWNLLCKYKKYTSILQFNGYTELLHIENMENIMKDINEYGNNI